MTVEIPVQIQLWHVITLAVTIIGAFYGLVKLLFGQFSRRMDERFEMMRTLYSQRLDQLEEQNQTLQRLDRDMLKLRLELADQYVRREDYIRGQSVIEAKLDAISLELKNVQIRQGAT